MHEMRIIYNPKARRGRVVSHFDKLAEAAQYRGFRLSLFRLSGQPDDIEKMLSGLQDNSVLIASGGDGTLQAVANALVAKDINIPVGILPYGTSNDFADSLGISTDIKKLLGFIDRGDLYPVDLGMAGSTVFVNVFSAGQIIKASHEVERAYKDLLGMLAYYLHTVGQLPKIAPFPVHLQGDIEESFNCFLLLVLNSTNAGGFKNLAPAADLSDGKLTVIAIRECSFPDMASVFFRVLRGEHENHPAVLCAKISSLAIDGPQDVATDIDGERAESLPTKISVLPRRMLVFGAKPIPQKSRRP
ncbi:MAG: diacylglycerol/lipid kinase family protein [Bacillota bacterium]|jgi:diacylglycerol kinase (ATP)